MHKKLLALLVLLTTLITACKKEEATTPEPEKQYIMPLKIGNKWMYSYMRTDSFGKNDTDKNSMITVEVNRRITRESYSPDRENLELLDKYEWYLVDGIGIICNADYNTVLKLNDNSTMKVDTFIYDTNKEKEIVSLVETDYSIAYHIAYGTLKDINGYAVKLNEDYALKKPENYNLGNGFYSYYSRGVGLVVFANSTRSATNRISYLQLTLRDYIIK